MEIQCPFCRSISKVRNIYCSLRECIICLTNQTDLEDLTRLDDPILFEKCGHTICKNCFENIQNYRQH
jgi:hypothetical protein